MALMATPSAAGRVFNIGSDQPISILNLAEKVVSLAKSDSPIQFQSYRDAYDSDFEDIRRRVPDLAKLRGTIKYEPKFDLDAIIGELIP